METSDQRACLGEAPVIALNYVEDAPLAACECAIGEVLAGRYRVERLIARGSMGVVVAATHLGFDELVAIKFIRPDMRGLAGIVSRFAREAKALVRVQNEHTVRVLDLGVTDPIGPYFVMEYLHGRDLEEIVHTNGPLGAAAATHYVLQACEALAAAHAQGIVHRDVKLQNMFLSRQGHVESIKLLDFGISKANLSGQIFGDDLSARERDWIMGTPLYMSPEQLRNTPEADARTDIWSLGVVLFELLCGEPPFVGDTCSRVYRQVLEAPERSIAERLIGVPPRLGAIIRRCLMQNRDERFADVSELAQALLPFAPPSSAVHVERAVRLLASNSVDWLDGALREHEAYRVEVAADETRVTQRAARPADPPWSWRPLSVAAATVIASALATMSLVHSCTPRLPEVRLSNVKPSPFVRLPRAGEQAPPSVPNDDTSRRADLVRLR